MAWSGFCRRAEGWGWDRVEGEVFGAERTDFRDEEDEGGGYDDERDAKPERRVDADGVRQWAGCDEAEW